MPFITTLNAIRQFHIFAMMQWCQEREYRFYTLAQLFALYNPITRIETRIRIHTGEHYQVHWSAGKVENKVGERYPLIWQCMCNTEN